MGVLEKTPRGAVLPSRTEGRGVRVSWMCWLEPLFWRARRASAKRFSLKQPWPRPCQRFGKRTANAIHGAASFFSLGSFCFATSGPFLWALFFITCDGWYSGECLGGGIGGVLGVQTGSSSMTERQGVNAWKTRHCFGGKVQDSKPISAHGVEGHLF